VGRKGGGGSLGFVGKKWIGERGAGKERRRRGEADKRGIRGAKGRRFGGSGVKQRSGA